MEVTSAGYTESGGIEAVINGITAFVPAESKNRHYRAIQAWVDEGNVIDPYVAPPAPPPLTDTQKLEQATGLTVAEIQAVLGI